MIFLMHILLLHNIFVQWTAYVNTFFFTNTCSSMNMCGPCHNNFLNLLTSLYTGKIAACEIYMKIFTWNERWKNSMCKKRPKFHVKYSYKNHVNIVWNVAFKWISHNIFSMSTSTWQFQMKFTWKKKSKWKSRVYADRVSSEFHTWRFCMCRNALCHYFA